MIDQEYLCCDAEFVTKNLSTTQPSQEHHMIYKTLCSLSTKVNSNFCDVAKIRLIIMNNENIFTIYESLL